VGSGEPQGANGWLCEWDAPENGQALVEAAAADDARDLGYLGLRLLGPGVCRFHAISCSELGQRERQTLGEGDNDR
jgi:hypothetical protein